MSIKFNCPACGAPMEYDGQTTLFQNCKSCGAPIVVPSEVVDANRGTKTDPAQKTASEILTQDAPEDLTADTSLPTPLDDPKVIADARIFEETVAGNKIAAIKLHRETFNSNLESAKAAIETLEREIAKSRQTQVDVKKEIVSTYEGDQELKQIYTAISGGRKIEAIKVFREKFNTGLKEAKEAVEAMERGEQIDISVFT